MPPFPLECRKTDVEVMGSFCNLIQRMGIYLVKYVTRIIIMQRNSNTTPVWLQIAFSGQAILRILGNPHKAKGGLIWIETTTYRQDLHETFEPRARFVARCEIRLTGSSRSIADGISCQTGLTRAAEADEIQIAVSVKS